MKTKYAKYIELEAMAKQLIVRYQKLLKELSKKQVELKKIRHEIDQIEKESPIVKLFSKIK